MPAAELRQRVEEALSALPILDAHTHLLGDHLVARGLQDVLLYHMLISDLYAAGCPSGNRLTEFPETPSEGEAHARIMEALSYLGSIRNTSMSWLLRMLLSDLYGWQEPITESNWRKLDATIRERSQTPGWAQEVLDRANIRRSVTEIARRESGKNDDRLQYSLEWAFFTRCQWGEFDTALYELERCWGRQPESPRPVRDGRRPSSQLKITDLDDVHLAIQHYVSAIPYNQILSTATHISTDIDYQVVNDREMDIALSRRDQAGRKERDIYASYIQENFLDALEQHAGEIVFQFSFGAEPLPFESSSRLSQRTIGQLGEMISRHPRLRFQCFLSSRHANQSMCTLARELPNLSLAGYWWHNFFPDAVRQVMSERLDMLPVNRQIGFFSDAYCVEWSYIKVKFVQKMLAQVLAERIEQGQYTFDEALSIASSILYESPQSLLAMSPRSP